MSQLEVSKAEAAEERSEQTRSFVRTVKAAARRKVHLGREDPNCSGGLPPRGHSQRTCAGGRGSSPTPTTRGPKEFMEAGKERLTRDSVRDATQHEVGQCQWRLKMSHFGRLKCLTLAGSSGL